MSEELGELLETPKAMNTTTQLETANVTVRKVLGLDNQQPSLALAGKVQRLGGDPVGLKRVRSAEHLIASGGDVVRAELKGSESCRKRVRRNMSASQKTGRLDAMRLLHEIKGEFGLEI